ncbi:MAG: 30S ribosomal protein S6 [Planctomycetes bacterium]|nr:30S ribosomal protein S6 [Planctomycetota bacterium]
MTDNQYIYQAMFLLDNGEVREQGFNAVREWVKSTLEKHGATVKVLRLWGERPLAYPIQGRARATYLLGYIQGTEQTVSAAKHEMYLLGPVFRHMFLKEDEIPAEELTLGIEEIKDEDIEVLDDTPVVEALFEDDGESEVDEEDDSEDEAPEEGAELSDEETKKTAEEGEGEAPAEAATATTETEEA